MTASQTPLFLPAFLTYLRVRYSTLEYYALRENPIKVDMQQINIWETSGEQVF